MMFFKSIWKIPKDRFQKQQVPTIDFLEVFLYDPVQLINKILP